MVERRRPQFPNQPNHGSNFRGARATPRTQLEARLLQSQHAKFKLRERFLERGREAQERKKDQDGYGLTSLPADAHEQEIITNLEKFKASSITGPTGSGKSTRTPHITRRAGYDLTIPLVPRVLIADGLHARLVEEATAYLGAEEAAQTIGLVHGDRVEQHDDDKVRVMTPNTFVRMEEDLRRDYGDSKVAIIADEIHEANLYTEIALGVAAQAVSKQENWRLVAMSATHNADALVNSFALINKGEVAPTVSIEGRPFDLEVYERPQQFATDVYAEVGADHERTMIFTSGKNEINHIIEQLTKKLESEERGSSSKVEFRKLHADLNRTMRNHAASPTPIGKRVVIVATPVGMSGITIPGVTCVITDGTINRPKLDDELIPGLDREYLSKAEVIQEMGRAGRDVPGGVGYLVKPTAIFEDKAREMGKDIVDEEMPYLAFDKRDEFGPAEIYHTNLASVALSIAANGYQFSEVNKYLPHQVEESDIVKAQEALHRIGAQQPADDGNLFVVSPIGSRMDEFPVRPELTRGLIEAQNNGRSLLQMARIALIVSAVESGGLQDYSTEAGDNWRQFLRDTTTDDMMAQYDLMTALPFTHEDYIDEKFVSEHDLSFKHVERSLKVSRKILKKLGIHRESIVLTPPNHEEEEEIRNDLTAGLIDSVYRKVGYRQKRQMYRNIHGDTGSTERYVSDRSIMSSHEHEYVAGFSRWFRKGKGSSKIKHDIIELAMPVDPEVVTQYASRNNILERTIVGAKIIDGAAVEQYQAKFGSITVGAPEHGSFVEEIPASSQEALVQYVLANQGEAQKALRGVAKELERYTTRVPQEELLKRVKRDSGTFLTADKIELEIRKAAKKTRIAYEIDRALALFIYQANIGIGRYFSEEDREELLAMSPSKLDIGGTYVALQYDSPEVPYVTMPQTEEMKELLKRRDMKLPDGREIKVKTVAEDGTVEYVSASTLS